MVAILDPLAVLSVRMTVDEYLDADLPEGYRYELVNGEIEVTPVPGTRHDIVVDRLNTLLSAYRQHHPERIKHISFQAAVAIPGKESLREPDVAVYSKWDESAEDNKTWKSLRPDLVIEVVSVGGESRDYQEKRDDYWAAGILEYWIADRASGTFTIFKRSDHKWDEQTFSVTDAFESACLPNLRVPVGRILGLNV
jgi:Uma2 family endonuclease